MANSDAVASREANLLEKLLEHRAAFLRFLTAKAGPEAAEDILQSAYLKLIEKGPQIQKDESIVSWFYTVLRHAMVDYFRRNATRAHAYEQFAADVSVSYETEIKANLCQCLSGVLQTLEGKYRDALQAVDLEGRSVAEYAQAERTTPNNAGVRLHRARRAAAKRLREVCGACAEHKCLDCTCRRPAM